ncbi:MAG: NAD(P)-dependent oxidoreductase [Euryarchaeota archaeon]|nr:NAD(P)-dependent oxidoreductase [Euryarchaeota archaeon]
MAPLALVTGACGFTGGHMVEMLRAQGWEVLATDLPAADPGRAKAQGAEFLPSDVTRPETLKPLFDRSPEVLFHPASLFDYFAPWEPLHRVNVVGMRNLCEAAAGSSLKRILHWSTLGVYGEQHNGECADENWPFNPPNLYSKSKAEQEKVVQEFRRERGLPFTILRPAPMYGPGNRYGMYHIHLLMAKTGSTVIPSIYPRTRRLRMPMLHVRDACGAALHLSRTPGALGEAYNAVTTMDFFIDEFMEFSARALHVPAPRIPVWYPFYQVFGKWATWQARRVEKVARRKGFRPKFDLPMAEYVSHRYWFSNEKLKKTGYRFLYEDWRKGIWETLGWYREQGWLP